jgi:hypothetical protein
MAQTLAAPTVSLSGGPGAGTILPASETALTATSVNFVNNGAIVLRVVTGSAGTGTLSVAFQETVGGQTITAYSIALANSASYLVGPFSPSQLNDANSLCWLTFSVITGNSAGLYNLPGHAY